MGFLADWAGESVRDKGMACNFLAAHSGKDLTREREGAAGEGGIGKAGKRSLGTPGGGCSHSACSGMFAQRDFMLQICGKSHRAGTLRKSI